MRPIGGEAAKRARIGEDDSGLTPVPVSMEMLTYAVKSGVKLENRFSEDELKKLSEYYGNNPQLLEGFEFFMNSER
jgi:hypothetical protein